MPMSEMPGWANTVMSALGGIGVGGYTISRIYRRDKNSDSIDDKSQKLIDNLSRQLDLERAGHAEQIRYERDNNTLMGNTIDRLAKERNDAVQNVGKLEGQVHALQSSVEHLQREVEKLELANTALIGQVSGMRLELAAMSRMMAGNHAQP